MTSSFFRFLIFVLFCSCSCFAQRTNLYWQPEVKINYNAQSRWSFNFKFSHRNLTNNSLSSRFNGEHAEFSHFSSYESGFYSKISLGLRYRNLNWFEPEKSNEYRITQQYNYSKNYNQYHIGHRLRFEERFYDIRTDYRARYRLQIQTPLQGLNLNTDEFYLSIATETLYTMSQKNAPELDQRFTARLGFQLSKTLKLEISSEYRHQNYLKSAKGELFGYTTALIGI